MKKFSLQALAVLSLASPVAMAQMVSLADIQKKGAVKLTAEQLRGAAEGARASYLLENRWTLNWKNEAGGKLTAAAHPPAGRPDERDVYGQGTWSIKDDGQYCLEIPRPKEAIKWCRFIYKAGNKTYSTIETDGKAYEIRFRLDKKAKKT